MSRQHILPNRARRLFVGFAIVALTVLCADALLRYTPCEFVLATPQVQCRF